MCTNCIYCKSKNCVIKKGKQKQEVKDIFVIVKSCGKIFILKSNGRNYDEEF